MIQSGTVPELDEIAEVAGIEKTMSKGWVAGKNLEAAEDRWTAEEQWMAGERLGTSEKWTLLQSTAAEPLEFEEASEAAEVADKEAVHSEAHLPRYLPRIVEQQDSSSKTHEESQDPEMPASPSCAIHRQIAAAVAARCLLQL